MSILLFTPICKPTLWGNESWEISALPGNETPVSVGKYKGKTLKQLIAEQKGKLIGEANYHRYGEEFPLLFKQINAFDDLSIQVHPNDRQAQQYGLPCGKTEMWFVAKARPEARLIAGFERALPIDTYEEAVRSGAISKYLNNYRVKAGDCFFIPAGEVHAIGAGLHILEIQQSSDITYRIYDHNRHDIAGKLRQLHLDKARPVINFQPSNDLKKAYREKQNERTSLITCPYFTTSLYTLNRPLSLDYQDLDSFVVLMVYEGDCSLVDEKGYIQKLQTGQTALLSASTHYIYIDPAQSGCRFLETYIS